MKWGVACLTPRSRSNVCHGQPLLYYSLLDAHLRPALEGLGFVADPVSINGRQYRANFTLHLPDHVLSVAFEPGEDHLVVLLFRNTNGTLSDIDDPAATLRLGSLNSAYAARAESHRPALDAELGGVSVSAPSEQRLMRKEGH